MHHKMSRPPGKSPQRVGLYVPNGTKTDNKLQQRLVQAGCHRILVEDPASPDPSTWSFLWSALHPGDTVIVITLAHLARSLGQLADWLDAFAAHGIMVKSLTEDIDTAREGDAFRTHVHQLAQWERTVIQARTRAGMEAARQQGKLAGRPRRLTAEELAEAERRLALGETRDAVARALGVSRSTLYRALKSS